MIATATNKSQDKTKDSKNAMITAVILPSVKYTILCRKLCSFKNVLVS